MTDVFVIGFGNVHDAERALSKLHSMANEGLLDLDAAGIAVRDQGGAVTYQDVDMDSPAGTGAAMGAMWGLLFGALFAPFTGGASAAAGLLAASTVIGVSEGAAVGALSKADFQDTFTSQLESLLRPGSCALVAMVAAYHRDTDDLLNQLGAIHGKVLQTNLTREAEGKLRHALAAKA